MHVSFISNWFTQAVEYWHISLSSHYVPVQTHQNNFSLILSNFVGKFEEIQGKLHSVVLILLQWVRALSVGAKSFCD